MASNRSFSDFAAVAMGVLLAMIRRGANGRNDQVNHLGGLPPDRQAVNSVVMAVPGCLTTDPRGLLAPAQQSRCEFNDIRGHRSISYVYDPIGCG
jgi:hypothetical protein